MAIKSKTLIRTDQINDKIDKARESAYERVFKGVQLARGDMLVRTQQGKGVDGQRFPGYSQAWAAQRRKVGAQTSVVDHFFGARRKGASAPPGMLRSISERIVSATKRAIKITVFPSADQEQKVRATNKLRRWFGFGDEERKRIIKTANE